MTEIGMALSNPLDGERRPGTVGVPLPGVDVHLVDEDGHRGAGRASRARSRCRGATVFREYWQRPDETQTAFRDGWFRTGDMAVVEDGYYRLLGRTSVDIIKTGGYKVSALEIEEVLRTHPATSPSARWSAWPTTSGASACRRPSSCARARRSALDELQAWAKARLAPYKIPRALSVVDALAAERDGQGGEAGGCPAVRMRPGYAARHDARQARDGHGGIGLTVILVGALWPAWRPAQRYFREGSFPRDLRPAATCPTRRSSSAAWRIERAPRAVRHRLADRLSLRRDQPDDAAGRADQDARQPRRRRRRRSTSWCG